MNNERLQHQLVLMRAMNEHRTPDEKMPEVADVPIIDNIDAKILRQVTNNASALNMDYWHSRDGVNTSYDVKHTCDTAHCRAGWAIHLAGEAGYRLQTAVGPALAGELIYLASRDAPAPQFYTDDITALDSLVKDASRYSK